jgi:hypothetical protein
MMRQRVKLVLLWLGLSAVLAPILYAVIPSLHNFIVSQDPIDVRLALFVVGCLNFGYFGPLFSLILLPSYGVALFGWASLAARTTILEQSTLTVAVFTAALAFPPAAIGAIMASEFAGTIRWDQAFEIFFSVFPVPWLALLLPRVVIRSLAPGTFSWPNARANV